MTSSHSTRDDEQYDPILAAFDAAEDDGYPVEEAREEYEKLLSSHTQRADLIMHWKSCNARNIEEIDRLRRAFRRVRRRVVQESIYLRKREEIEAIVAEALGDSDAS